MRCSRRSRTWSRPTTWGMTLCDSSRELRRSPHLNADRNKDRTAKTPRPPRRSKWSFRQSEAVAVRSSRKFLFVIPREAGIHVSQREMDPSLREDDFRKSLDRVDRFLRAPVIHFWFLLAALASW